MNGLVSMPPCHEKAAGQNVRRPVIHPVFPWPYCFSMKNCNFTAGLRMFVDRFRLPPPSRLLVRMGVHWLNGLATLVEPSRTYCPPFEPFTALRFNVVPLTLMLVNSGCGVRSRT